MFTREFVIGCYHNIRSDIQIGDSKSPYPGVVMRGLFNMNIYSFHDNNGKRAKFAIKNYIDAGSIDEAYRYYNVPIPQDNEESIRNWIQQVISTFSAKVKKNGFAFCG